MAASLGDADSAPGSGAEDGRLRQLEPLRMSCCGSEGCGLAAEGHMHVKTHHNECHGSLTSPQAASFSVLWSAQTGKLLMQARSSGCTCSAELPEVALMAMTVVAADLLAVADGWGEMSGELPALLVTLKADPKLCAIGCCRKHSLFCFSSIVPSGILLSWSAAMSGCHRHSACHAFCTERADVTMTRRRTSNPEWQPWQDSVRYAQLTRSYTHLEPLRPSH